MKVITELIFGPHRAFWHYNVARWGQRYYLILGTRGDVEKPGLVGFEIDPKLISAPIPCSYTRYLAPLEPAELPAVILPHTAVWVVWLAVKNLTQIDDESNRFQVVESKGCWHIVLSSREADGRIHAYSVERDKIHPAAAGSMATHVYGAALDFTRPPVLLPPEIMLDRVTLIDFEDQTV